MSFPTVQGRAVEGVPYREAQSCLGPAFAVSTYKFFVTGTNTPANVYQNGTLTVPFPITGQVTSDNYGRFPPIYLDTSVIYRVRLYNSANVQQWQVDPYTAPLSTVGTSSLSAYGLTLQPTGEVTVLTPNTGGSGTSLTLKAGSSGSGTTPLRLNGTAPGNSTLIVNSSVSTGAQTATFAATNKPGTATSSPAGWLPIFCDGGQFYAPIWHANPFSPYVANPSAGGEVIVASSVTFTGTGLTTATNGTATPGNWYSPTTAGVGAGYYINITKTGGLSGLAFSAAQGTWTNIGSGGLTVSSNAQSPITGTYQLSTSVTGTPVVASGTITLQSNNGVQSPTYNGATPLVLDGDGTATLSGGATSNWFAPTTASTGASYWINITQTGGTSGCTFSAASGAWTNITNGGLSIGINGGSGASYNVIGTYQIASDAAGVNVLGSGTVTLTGGSSVQSPNYSGTTPLKLNGDGSATQAGASTSSWLSPNIANSGSGYWINITRTSGAAGVNFSAAQGSWTNITNSGLTIDMTGYTGDVGTVSVGGTYQISSSSSGMPVLGSGTIALSVNAGSVLRVYSTAVTGATETVPIGATTCVCEAWGASAGGGGGYSSGDSGGGGAAGGYCRTSLSVTGGNTFTYTVGAAGSPGGNGTPGSAGGAGTASSISSGTQSIGTMTANGGGAGQPATGVSVPGGASAGGAASGGTLANTTGGGGAAGAAGAHPGAGGTPPAGVNGTGSTGGIGGGFGTNPAAGGAGVVTFKYS